MPNSTITMSDDAHALAIYAAISGRTSHTELIDQTVTNRVEETEKKTLTTIADVVQFRTATALVGKLRACLGRFATNVEPLGYITDPARLAEFRAEVAEVTREIDDHNGVPNQPHRIKYDVLVLPVGRILDERSQKRLCETVSEALTEAKALLQKGDVKELGYWLQHRKNLGGLMPSIVGRVVDSAIDQLTYQRKRVMKLIKDGERSPVEAGALADVDLINDALVWVSTSQTGVVPETAVQ